MILYLHGFRSSPSSRKALLLRERLRRRGLDQHYVCPQLPASPSAAARIALDAVDAVAAGDLALIGSSLGGFYATWLAEKRGCRAVLLNPAIDPARDLQAHIGRQPVYFSDQEVDFRPEFIDQLRELEVQVTQPERYFLIAATGDTVIDYRTMIDKYRGARQSVIAGGDHELSDFAQHVDEVMDFCGISLQPTTKEVE